MTKLLQGFRRKSSRKKKFYKYILYAIGEVFLIVVGILIAISIDNWNDARKNEQAVDSISAAICNDLREDISQFESLLRRHYWLDSLLQRVIDGTLTEQDYRNNWTDLHTLISKSFGYYAHKNGYSALQAIVENTPDNFHRFIGDLTDYYTYSVDGAVFATDREDQLVWNTIEDWGGKYEWNYETRGNSDINMAKMDYLLHSAEYKNKATTFLINTSNTISVCDVGRYNALRLYTNLASYREVALDSTYNDLQELLEIESPTVLSSCDRTGNEEVQSRGVAKSIVLIRNRTDQPLKLSVISENGVLEEATEFGAASLDFHDFANGDIVRLANGKGDCLGYFVVGVKNLVVEVQKPNDRQTE